MRRRGFLRNYFNGNKLMNKLKSWGVGALWLFVAAAVVFQIAKIGRDVEQNVLPEGVGATFFCASVRCASCEKMERLFRETANDLNELNPGIFKGLGEGEALNYEAPENRAIAEEFGVATSCVLLTEIRDGKTARYKNLASECWRLLGDDAALKSMLSREITAFYNGNDAEPATTEGGAVELDGETLFD